MVTASLTDGDGPAGTAEVIAVTYAWFVPKVNRPDLENEDHWIAAGHTATSTAGDLPNRSHQTQASTCAWLRRTSTGSERTMDKAYARTAHPVAAPRAANNDPSIPAGTPTSFTVAEHAAVGTIIGTVRGADVDTSDILSHELPPETIAVVQPA